MKTKFYLALALIAALFTSSCNTSTSDWVVTQNLPGCFSNAIDNTTHENELNSSVSVSMSINYTKNNSEVVITGLKLPDGSSFQQIKLSELPIEQKDGWYIIKADNVTIDTGSSYNTPTISHFEMRLLERTFTLGTYSEYQPALAVSFTVNSNYNVHITRIFQYVGGTTNCRGPQSTFSTKETFYVFNFDAAKQKLEIGMMNARFMEPMKKMNFVVKNIDFKMEGGNAVFSAETLIPTVGNTPNDKYPITNLSGSFDPINGFNLSFDCAPGSVPGQEFIVNAQGSFTDFPQNEED